MNCLHCNKYTENPKFCSRSCSATMTNRTNPRRKKDPNNICSCGKSINYRTLMCIDCLRAQRELRTLDEMCRDKNFVHRRSLYGTVRAHARGKMDRLGIPQACYDCGYSVHVQVCHIKPLHTFEGSATLGEVNDLSNLRYLCPNHHWELDHHLASYSGVEPESGNS
jgi:hypothetical protein